MGNRDLGYSPRSAATFKCLKLKQPQKPELLLMKIYPSETEGVKAWDVAVQRLNDVCEADYGMRLTVLNVIQILTEEAPYSIDANVRMWPTEFLHSIQESLNKPAV
jgi:hypothetical protein